MRKGTLENTQDRQVILGRLSRMTSESARQWGKMSPHQAVCHLCDSFRGVMGDRTLSGKPFPFGGAIKWVALYSPLQWSKNLPTMPEVDQMKLGSPPVEFVTDSKELERLVARFSTLPHEFSWKPHPFFGTMQERDWMRWGWLHMDHHFRQFGN
jgi:hypothetical protein